MARKLTSIYIDTPCIDGLYRPWPAEYRVLKSAVRDEVFRDEDCPMPLDDLVTVVQRLRAEGRIDGETEDRLLAEIANLMDEE